MITANSSPWRLTPSLLPQQPLLWWSCLPQCDDEAVEEMRTRKSPLSVTVPSLQFRNKQTPKISWSWHFAKRLYVRCDAWVEALLWLTCQSPVAHSCGLLNHLNTFCGGMLKLDTKLAADLSIYLFSHFECDGHTVHVLTHRRLPPPLTSTVKSSLFTHACSSPLSLAAGLNWCCASCSHYINNGWIFSGQTLYFFISFLIF